MDDPFRIQPGDDEPRIPEALRRDLGRAYGPNGLGVPPEVDEHVAQMARHRLAGRLATASGQKSGLSWAGRSERRRRMFPVRLVTMSAAAAAILLVVLVTPRFSTVPTTTSSPGAMSIALRGDVDNDGRVDIVDALVLSKRLRDGKGAGPATGGDWDLNADGVVDEADAVAIRGMVVKLEGGAG